MIFEEVIKDIENRSQQGLLKYGKPLEPFHNRHQTGSSAAFQDLYEELLDAAQYCKQRLVEEDVLFTLARRICDAKRLGNLALLLEEVDELTKTLDKL